MQVVDQLERPRRVSDRLHIQPLAPSLGAEISGVDLTRPLSADSVDRIRRAFVDHGVIFFATNISRPRSMSRSRRTSVRSTSIASFGRSMAFR